MKAFAWPIFIVLAALATGAAIALPEGAPWGSANPGAAENCGSCHFGYDPEIQSTALGVHGIPEAAEPGRTYEIEIRFSDPEASVAGFQLVATAGAFSARTKDVESLGSAVRSIRSFAADAGFRWTVSWTAPPQTGVSITFFAAAVGGNDDLSPFGDRAYFRTFETSL